MDTIKAKQIDRILAAFFEIPSIVIALNTSETDINTILISTLTTSGYNDGPIPNIRSTEEDNSGLIVDPDSNIVLIDIINFNGKITYLDKAIYGRLVWEGSLYKVKTYYRTDTGVEQVYTASDNYVVSIKIPYRYLLKDLPTDAFIKMKQWYLNENSSSGGGGGGGDLYTNEDETPTTIGGIPASSTFFEQTMQQMWTALLYPYISPSFTSFYIDGYPTSVVELGTEIAAATEDFKWSTNPSDNVKIDSIELSGHNLVTVADLADDGIESLPITGVVTRKAVDSPGSRSWLVKGTNTNDIDFQRSFAVTWWWKIYYGASPLTTLTEANIKGLSNQPLKNSTPGTYNSEAENYKFFCIPNIPEFIAPTSFTDASGGANVAMYAGLTYPELGWSYDLVSVTNDENETVEYRVYRTQNPLVGVLGLIVS